MENESLTESSPNPRPLVPDFDALLTHASTLSGKRVAVVSPGNAETFSGIVQAQQTLHAFFVLAGDSEVIQHGMSSLGGDPSLMEIIHRPDPKSALRAAINAVRDEKADILMKGSVDTGTMMKAVLEEGSGLRTGRLLSDIFILEYPPRTPNKFIMITDGGITLAPDLKDKIELIRNAVEVAHALGNTMPKVAMLSATEFVLPNLQSTVDAAVLSKMNERGQITGCIVDGPFALDNAISGGAAAEKRIKSEVAGQAEIMVAANIESANSLAKSTTYFAGLRLAHVIVGARVPILIPSRADKSDAKLLSIALGMIMASP
jgi:phosphate butyryltransferase